MSTIENFRSDESTKNSSAEAAQEGAVREIMEKGRRLADLKAKVAALEEEIRRAKREAGVSHLVLPTDSIH